MSPFASAGASQHLFAPYKVATWKSIPKNQKARNGTYYQDYGGFISFGCNLDLLDGDACPTTWSAAEAVQVQERRRPQRQPAVGQRGAVRSLGRGVNNGGSAKNIAPGVDFFKQLMSCRELQLDRLQLGVRDRDLVPDHDQLGLPEHGRAPGA